MLKAQPLAARMRPRKLDEMVGQLHLLDSKSPLHRALEAGEPFSMILWGPPGCGKTTLGLLVAETCALPFHHLSAVTFSVKDVRELMQSTEGDLWGGRVVLFLDEIHRLNKAQQDVLLPHVEEGRIILVGATTENPAFEVNKALLSRCRVFRLEPLTQEELSTLLHRALADSHRGLGGMEITLSAEAEDAIHRYSGGDARAAIGILEEAAIFTVRQQHAPPRTISLESVRQAAGTLSVHHDKKGEEHYNVISAFIKSMRGGDPDAALYYLARMIEGGEEPRFIFRRILICASEDVGLADPVPLMLAQSAATAFESVGLPEGRYLLAHAALSVCLAPKSNSLTKGINAALEAVRGGAGRHPVPLHLHGALGPQEHAQPVEYAYPHDYPGHHVSQQYLPTALAGTRFYTPTTQGREEAIKKLLQQWKP